MYIYLQSTYLFIWYNNDFYNVTYICGIKLYLFALNAQSITGRYKPLSF